MDILTFVHHYGDLEKYLPEVVESVMIVDKFSDCGKFLRHIFWDRGGTKMRCSCGYEFESAKIERCPLCGKERPGNTSVEHLESELERKVPEDIMDEGTEPTYKLYSPGQIRVATFLGTPVAGSLLLATNFRKFDKVEAANKTLLLGLISTLALMALALVVPERFPNFIIPIAYTGIMVWIVKEVYKADYDRYILQGGEKCSNWHVAGIVFGCFVGVLVVMFVTLMLIPSLSF